MSGRRLQGWNGSKKDVAVTDCFHGPIPAIAGHLPAALTGPFLFRLPLPNPSLEIAVGPVSTRMAKKEAEVADKLAAGPEVEKKEPDGAKA